MGGGLLAVKTNEEKHSIRDIIRHGRLPFENGLAHYVHEMMGFNYQISGYSAALIHAQLPYLEDRVARKREIFDTYCSGFRELDHLHPQSGTTSSNHTRWLSCFQVKSGPESRTDSAKRFGKMESSQGRFSNPCISNLRTKISHAVGANMQKRSPKPVFAFQVLVTCERRNRKKLLEVSEKR